MSRIIIGFIFIFVSSIVLGSFFYGSEINIEISKYPDGKDFAFTITDDPDYGWLEEKFVVYGLLNRMGFKTTIPVWVVDNHHGTGEEGVNSGVGGVTTTNEEYLEYTQQLQKEGFEIALHTVGPGNDLREETANGYELFKQQFGSYPKININHSSNLDNIYWGGDRFSNKILRYVYNLYSLDYQGDKEDSEYFWGDIAREKTKYVRSWATDSVNTLAINKSMPYHLDDKPYVNYWFGCSDGYNFDKFIKILSDENINELEKKRGTSIIYTHFGYGFVDKETGALSEEFIMQMTRLSKKDGWFVPVSTILDRFILLRNVEVIEDGYNVIIVNHNNKLIRGLTILTDQKELYLVNEEKRMRANDDGEIILGDLPPYSVFKLRGPDAAPKSESPEIFERMRIVWNWFVGRFD